MGAPAHRDVGLRGLDALGPGGAVARFDADGALDELLEVKADFVSSVCFAGTDLIVTTATDVRRAAIGVAGRRIPLARCD